MRNHIRKTDKNDQSEEQTAKSALEFYRIKNYNKNDK